MRAFPGSTVSRDRFGGCSQVALQQPRIPPLARIGILMVLTALVFTLMTPMPARARNTVPIESLWHIQGVEVASGSPLGLYLPTHQGVFFADIDGVAARLSRSNDDFRSFVRHPSSPRTFYAGVATPAGINLGVMISEDGAKTWRNLSPVGEHAVAFHTLAISAVDPNVLYGAAGEVYISVDAGRSWSVVGSPGSRIHALAASSTDPNTVYAATDNGVWRSADAGNSWALVRPSAAPVTMIHADARGNLYAFFVEEGLLRTAESHFNWTLVDKDFGQYIIMHFAVSASEPPLLFAVTDNSELFVSENDGHVWTRIGSPGGSMTK